MPLHSGAMERSFRVVSKSARTLASRMSIPLLDHVIACFGMVVHKPPQSHRSPSQRKMQYCILSLTAYMQCCIIYLTLRKQRANSPSRETGTAGPLCFSVAGGRVVERSRLAPGRWWPHHNPGVQIPYRRQNSNYTPANAVTFTGTRTAQPKPYESDNLSMRHLAVELNRRFHNDVPQLQNEYGKGR